MKNNHLYYSLIGIGVGPSNLSLSALLNRVSDSNALFLEKNWKFNWHPNMMFSFSKINVPFYKDLVSLVDPTNPFSFLNYLVVHHKQYAFFNAGFNRVSRKEFENYYKWAAYTLPNISFNQPVTSLKYDEKHDVFNVTARGKTYHTKTVVIGTGIKAKIPDFQDAVQTDGTVLHCYD